MEQINNNNQNLKLNPNSLKNIYLISKAHSNPPPGLEK
jgi:hypothetical protein